MTQTIRVRGYAAPYEQIIPYDDDEYQVIERGAFSSMLRGALPPIDIRWGSHSDDAEVIASTADRNVGFFEDDYGLGFWFDVDVARTWGKLKSMMASKNACDRCSVNMLVSEHQIEKPFRESRLYRIKHATIDHVAVGLTRAAYMNTGTWTTHCSLERAPLRIQELAERWERGRVASLARAPRQAPTVVSKPTAALRGPRGEMAPTDASRLLSLLASRQKHYAEIRRSLAAGIMGRRSSTILAHTAFTRAAGFDGDFKRSLSGRR